MLSLFAVPLGAARGVLDRTVEVAEFAVSVPGRVVNLLETTEALVARIDNVVTDAREIVDGMVVDFDAEGRPVGINIQHASRDLDLSAVEIRALPAHNVGRET